MPRVPTFYGNVNWNYISSYKVGRQIFAMANDPDENISSDTPDQMAATVIATITGDSDTFLLTEMGGTDTAIFTGVGPVLDKIQGIVIANDRVLEVFDNEPLIIFLGDVNDPAQLCLTMGVAGG